MQRHVVLGVRLNKSFQSVGGAAQFDEARETVLLERFVAVDQQVVDLVVVAEAALDGKIAEPSPNILAANNRDQRRRMESDQLLNDLGVVLVLEKL